MPFQGLMTMSWSPLPSIAVVDKRSLPASFPVLLPVLRLKVSLLPPQQVA